VKLREQIAPGPLPAYLHQWLLELVRQVNVIQDDLDAVSGGGHAVHGRLTLESGVPVSTTDQTGKTTVYFTPYRGNQIDLWDGSAWTRYTFTETSLALGTITSGKNYDVFGYQSSGTLTLEMLAWTNDTARATAVTLQDGRYCKSGDKTRLFLGTFRTTSTTTTEDSAGGSVTQVGGKRFLWNYYNRTRRFFGVFDSTSSWSYTTAAWRQANNTAANKIEYVCGMQESIVEGVLCANVNQSTNSTVGLVAIGLDSTTATSGLVAEAINSNTAAVNQAMTVPYYQNALLGYHYLAWLEYGYAGGGSFQGSLNGCLSGFLAGIEC
jgi:hypothetical protein